MKKKRKIMIVIVGPTAVGKTPLAVRLAELLGTEVVSADSRQLYREMRIGTARPSDEELGGIPHHFVGCKSIEEGYSAVQYGEDVLGLVRKIFKKKCCIILCGGSGLYVKAVCEGFDKIPPVNPEIRAIIAEQYKQKGLVWLQQQVAHNDPDFFATVDVKNPRRLMRALELNYATQRPLKELRKNHKRELPFKIIKIGLNMNRKELYDHIDKRIDTMMKKGLLIEVKALFPYRDRYHALETVGYRELFGYIEGAYSLEKALSMFKKNTRKYAKRQLTWFKKDVGIQWFHPRDWGNIYAYIKSEAQCF